MQPSLEEALALIFQAEEAGRPLSVDAYVERWPHLREPLLEFWHDRTHFARWAAHLGADTGGPQAPAAGPIATGAPAPAAVDPAGRIQGYEVLQELGRGGMGVVYRARQLQPVRLVALKMIRADRLEALPAAERRAWVGRLQREAQMVASLEKHPHIVTLYEAGEALGQPYFTMQLVEGGSLAERLRGEREGLHRRDLSADVRLLAKVARAIEFAHRHGILHCDLKPGNILLDAAGEPLVSDFGLARRLDHTGSTAPGGVEGTASYMAPEQAAGRKGAATTAADVYGLGAILYEILTGQPPFRGQGELETLLLVMHQEPVRPRVLDPRVPADLETVCLKALEKEPQARYGSAAALADDLDNWLADRPIRARRSGSGERLWRWARRNPLVAGLAASIALGVVLFAVSAVLVAVYLRSQLTRAEQAEYEALAERQRDRHLADARRLRQTSRPGRRFEGLALLAEAAQVRRDPELRGEVIASLVLDDVRPLRQWPANTGAELGVAFDADLERYATVGADGTVCVRRVADDQDVGRLPGPGARPQSAAVCFSPVRRLLAVGHQEAGGKTEWRLWDFEGDRVERSFAADGLAFAYSPDGRWAAFGQPAGGIGLLDLDQAGAPARSLGAGLKSPRQIVFHPTRQLVAVCPAREHAGKLLDLETDQVLSTPSQESVISALAWRGDGRVFALGLENGVTTSYAWDQGSFRPLAQLEGHPARVVRLRFNPANDLLACSSADETTSFWDAVRDELFLTSYTELLDFSRDGRGLAFRSGPHVGVSDVAGGREYRRLYHRLAGPLSPWQGFDGPWAVEFSPDGRLLASAAGDGVRLWDSQSGRELAHLATGGACGSVHFCPDGRQLVTYSWAGLVCWPVGRPAATSAGQTPPWQIGPPRTLNHFYAKADACAWSRDGRFLAAIDSDVTAREGQVAILRGEGLTEHRRLHGPPRLEAVALSPDGRWVAAGTYRGDGVQVWDAASGRPVWHSPVTETDPKYNALVGFSPDGQWLLTAGQSDHRLWYVGNWTPGLVLPRNRREERPAPFAFSADGRLLAVARSPHGVQLLDPETGREQATLPSPDGWTIHGLAFSPDGGRLAAATSQHALLLWDLRLLHQQLAALHLEGGLPAPAPPGPSVDPQAVRVIPNEQSAALGRPFGVAAPIEVEQLKALAWGNCNQWVQDMAPWGGKSAWGDGKQVLCECTQKGGYVEFELPSVAPGAYWLDIYFTRAPDYGKIEVRVDGKQVGAVFDGYYDEVSSSGKVEYGAVELGPGRHRIRFESVGRNERSLVQDARATGYNMGIDFLELRLTR
jgi:WD40 repeat protein